jgi:polyphosphate kinase
VKGLSENIRARRVVDRFLEHARVVRFENGGDREIWLSSADWMPRNLTGRIELAFPVSDARHARDLEAMLECQIADTDKGGEIGPDGENLPRTNRVESTRSQAILMKRLARRS